MNNAVTAYYLAKINNISIYTIKTWKRKFINHPELYPIVEEWILFYNTTRLKLRKKRKIAFSLFNEQFFIDIYQTWFTSFHYLGGLIQKKKLSDFFFL